MVQEQSAANGKSEANIMKDILDAEYEMVDPSNHRKTDTSSHAKGSDDEAATRRTDSDGAESQLGVFAGREPGDNEKKRMPLGRFTVLAFLACLGAFLISGGYTVVGDVIAAMTHVSDPDRDGTSELGSVVEAVTVDGMTLRDVVFERKLVNGREFLSVEGGVLNESDTPRTIPALRLTFGPRDSKARFRINRGETLKPGEQLVFTSRIGLRDTAPDSPKLEFIR